MARSQFQPPVGAFGSLVCGLLLAAIGAASPLASGVTDWPEMRGATRDGRSAETGLPATWSPAGENLAWRAPYGGRSTPVVAGNRLCVLNSVGQPDSIQERVMCLNADTGTVLWEYRYNVSLSDVPVHRAAWSSPAIDLATGNVYVFGGAAHLIALGPDGTRLWQRPLNQEFGAITTHGGRTVSPVIEGDLVIVSCLVAGWGDLAAPRNRFFAFDKRTGKSIWISSPQQRHYDTNYAQPTVADINGTKLLITGGTDGVAHALKLWTGEPVWNFEFSKRALNTAIVMHGTNAIVSHSEENLDTSEMGMIAAIDAAATGKLGKDQVKWATLGWQGGYASPVVDEKAGRLYMVDNGAILGAFDLAGGKQLWTHTLGTLQKAPAVLADGKLYIGTENGKFYILRPRADGVDVLDGDRLGTEAEPEAVLAGAAVSNGRVYVVSMGGIYAIGRKGQTTKAAAPAAAPAGAAAGGEPASVLVVPAEAYLRNGESARFTARLYDAKGNFLREEAATWTTPAAAPPAPAPPVVTPMGQPAPGPPATPAAAPAAPSVPLGGTVATDGTYTAAAEGGPRAGLVKATVGSLSGTARVRVVPPPPWSFDFESPPVVPAPWVTTAAGKFAIKELDGSRTLARPTDLAVSRRGRVLMGPTDLSDYTIEADVRVAQRGRNVGDIGLIAQQYVLVLFGNAQKVELQPWQPATAMTVAAPFPWKPDAWYRMKLRAQNQADGSTRVQGKVWLRGETEPTAWTVEKVDRIGRRDGAPGLYSDANAELYFDNIKVVRN